MEIETAIGVPVNKINNGVNLREIVEDCVRAEKAEWQRQHDDYNKDLSLFIDNLYKNLVDKIVSRNIVQKSVFYKFRKDILSKIDREKIRNGLVQRFRNDHNIFLSEIHIQQEYPTSSCIHYKNVDCECLTLTMFFCCLPLFCWLPWYYYQKYEYTICIRIR